MKKQIMLAIYRALKNGGDLTDEQAEIFVNAYNGETIRRTLFVDYVLSSSDLFCVCENCQDLAIQDRTPVVNGTETWCEHCIEEHAFSCACCSELYSWNRRIYTHNSDYICSGCYENDYFTCDSCGEVFPSHMYSQDGVCTNCDKSVPRVVWDYHQTTAPAVCGYGPKERDAYWIGLEIEFQHKDGFSGAAEKIENDLLPITDGKAIWARDSSVAVELITRPTSRNELSALLQDLTGARLYQKGFRVNSGAGLHINISRSAFDCDDSAARFDYFINRMSHLTVAVSGRDRSDWAAIDYHRTIERSLEAVVHLYEGKYRAVRWGSDRLEIRTPQSSTLGHILLSRLDYFLALIDYANLPEGVPSIFDFRSYWNLHAPGFTYSDCAPNLQCPNETLHSFIQGRI